MALEDESKKKTRLYHFRFGPAPDGLNLKYDWGYELVSDLKEYPPDVHTREISHPDVSEPFFIVEVLADTSDEAKQIAFELFNNWWSKP